MPEDQIFRIIIIVGLATIMPVGMYHRLKAHAAGDRIDRREEGLFILLTLRPVSAVGILGVIAYAINPAWMAWSAVPLPHAMRWAGVACGVLSAALFILSFRALGTNITDTVVTRAKHTLVTRGPYRYVRHPFYVACALAVIATTLVTANWVIGLSGLLSMALLVKRTATEESNLRARFGAAYDDYVSTTGRFFPKRPRGSR